MMDTTAETTIDLDAYFRRIGYQGPRAPTLDTLRAIHALHPASIAFENLNPLLGWEVKLDAASLQEKMVRNGRGGWCFEQNLLLRGVLLALGFRVTGLAGRVMWNQPPGEVRPRSHMCLRIDLDEGTYVADVGFGGVTLTAPLRLETEEEQPTPHEPFRLARMDGDYVMQVKIRGEWQSLYRFDLQPQHRADYEVTSFYLCHHPKSHFRAGLIAARSEPGLRHALRDGELVTHHANGATERRAIADAAALRHALETTFRLTLPESPELDAALERLTARPVLAGA
jgi:N-hydroxyarylamine O-acetyltransferase